MSKAVVVTRFGGPDVLDIIDRPVPQPGPGQVRVRIEATALHPADLGVRAGVFAARLAGTPPPYPLGWDLAGIIEAVGAGVTEWNTGQQVVGFLHYFQTLIGTHAEHAVVGVDALTAAPKTLTAAEAATLPLNALTATQALDLSGLSEGQSVLITGAAGALGGYLTELAVRRGLRVVAVAGSADEDWLRQRGANDVIARTDGLVGAVRWLLPDGVDGAIDAARVGQSAVGAVRDGGVFVGVTPPQVAPDRGITVDTVQVHPDREQLAEIVAAADRGELTARVADVYPLERAAEAHARQEQGGLRGRLVLTP
jgi:NADPH:quinone reductase-like Zn-dependent oxidoreductase